MGILDNVTSAMNRGTESAGRAAEKLKLKNQINEINKRRQQLAAQLGASLYEATKSDPALREGRETLYDGIAAADAERDACMRGIEALEIEADASRTFACPVCNATVGAADLFCSGCGTPVDQIKPQATTQAASAFCMECGSPIQEGDAFCMSCGWKVA